MTDEEPGGGGARPQGAWTALYHRQVVACPRCDGTGLTSAARILKALWYAEDHPLAQALWAQYQADLLPRTGLAAFVRTCLAVKTGWGDVLQVEDRLALAWPARRVTGRADFRPLLQRRHDHREPTLRGVLDGLCRDRCVAVRLARWRFPEVCQRCAGTGIDVGP